jgi:protein-tyrosine-phosphatase
MREIGIDLSSHRPQLLTQELADQDDVVVTMGCGDACPVILGKRYIDWDLEDPKDKGLERVREIRDEIAARIEQLLEELGGEGKQ